mmetsp:Transcript_13750/g.26161  ORF Transcript_13750/g.26161 Transcript_13750/m.26161 type:complete len:622 (-) Transcript_13750:75-1940(-)
MGQKHGRHSFGSPCCSPNPHCGSPGSPLFAVDTVRGEPGSIKFTGRYHTDRNLMQDYYLEKKILGTGINGPVRLARRGKQRYAVKSFHKRRLSAEARTELRREVEVYLKLDHPHVARLEDVYETHRDLHIVMELMAGGELYERLAQRRQYAEADAAGTARQMLLAVAYLHAHSVVHRDLKLENFLYESQNTTHLKLIDFGFAKFWEQGQKMSRSCGSLHYIAPEVLAHSYTEKADMWSLGVLVYMLLTGSPPFYGSTDDKCLLRIKRGEPQLSSRWPLLSESARRFVMSLLVVDPEKRLSASAALQHHWICSVDTPKAAIDTDVLSSLRRFAHASHFRRACLSMMAWSLTVEDQQELRLQFQALDQNKTGTLTLQELASALETTFHIDSAEAEALFHGLDMDGGAEIQYSEFLAAALQDRVRMHEAVLHATFARFDVDGSGSITADNLRALLGDSFEGSGVEELLREADRDGDGAVSYEEFLAYLQEDEEDESNEMDVSIDGQWSSEAKLHQLGAATPRRRGIGECARIIDTAFSRQGSPASPVSRAASEPMEATTALLLPMSPKQLPDARVVYSPASLVPLLPPNVRDEGIFALPDQQQEPRWKLCFQRAKCWRAPASEM